MRNFLPVFGAIFIINTRYGKQADDKKIYIRQWDQQDYFMGSDYEYFYKLKHINLAQNALKNTMLANMVKQASKTMVLRYFCNMMHKIQQKIKIYTDKMQEKIENLHTVVNIYQNINKYQFKKIKKIIISY